MNHSSSDELQVQVFHHVFSGAQCGAESDHLGCVFIAFSRKLIGAISWFWLILLELASLFLQCFRVAPSWHLSINSEA